MRLYLVRERVRQVHYLVYWATVKDNLADSLIKDHPTKNHRSIRGTYLVPTSNSSKHACYQIPSKLQGCVKYPPARETDNIRTWSPPAMNVRSTDRDRQATRYRRQ